MQGWVRAILMAAFASLFAYSVIKSIRTGQLKPSRYDRIYLRSEDPGTFWFHVAVYAIVACAMYAAAVAWL